jgi:hypothetical protein
MRIETILVGAAVTVLAIWPASATMRITNNGGGEIGPYLDRLTQLLNSGQRVAIDGPCLSACTLLLGVIPRERLCVTRRARFGFHAAWRPNEAGLQVTSPEGTQLMMTIYPQEIRDWISRHGGLTPRMMYLTGRELAAMYPACK